MRRRLAAILVTFAATAASAQSGETRALSGPEISAMISGNTVEGNMAASGPYREFYLPDGTLKGSNYEGRWRVVEDTLCFSYDSSEPTECWSANLARSGEIVWLKNGVVDGSGVVQNGNPAEF